MQRLQPGRVLTHLAQRQHVLHGRFEPTRGLLQRTQRAHRQLPPGTRQRHGIDVPGLLPQQLGNFGEQLFGLLRRGGGLDDELPGQCADVGRAGREIGQPAAFTDLVEQRRAHALAQQRGGQHPVQVCGVVQRRGGVPQHHLALAAAGHAALFHTALPERRGHGVGPARRHGAERGFDEPHEFLRIHRPGRGHHHVVPAVVLCHPGLQVVAREALQIRAVADDGLPRRVQTVAGGIEEAECHAGRVFVEFGELVQDHLALTLQLFGREAAVQHDVGQHGHEARQIGRQAVDVEGRVVLVGVGIDLGTQAFGVEVDLLAAARGCALEGHVLDDMADAIQPPWLVVAAGANEDAEVDGLAPGLGDDQGAHAVGQAVQEGVGRAHGWQVWRSASMPRRGDCSG